MKKCNSISSIVKDFCGNDVRISSKRAVSGGDINAAYILMLSNGDRLFLKENDCNLEDMFLAEGKGLLDISHTKTIGCPTPIAYGVDDESGKSFLLLSYINSDKPERDYWYNFGISLAKLHLSPIASYMQEGKNYIYGGNYDNYIGYTPQNNTPNKSWVDFFRERRLRPQLDMAYRSYQSALYERSEALLENLGNFLDEPKYPSLLHGDLWSGNAMTGEDGKAWLIDPASYIGHNEVDLAMTQLFGGFPKEFYNAYNEVLPISKNYEIHKKT